MAAAVPRHGARRLPRHPDDDGRRPRAGRAAGLPRPPRQLDAVDLRLAAARPPPGPNFSWVLATRALQRMRGPRPVAADARAVAAPSRSTRPPSRRSSPPPSRSGSGPAACSRRSAWPRWRSAARSRRRGRGLVCDTVDRVVLERDRVAKPVDDRRPRRARRSPPAGCRCSARPVPGPGDAHRRSRTRSRTVPERHVGELLIRGTSVTPGYYKRPDATAALFHDGWLCTGDLAYLLDGELVLCGRIKDVIIVGGRNVFPEDIERAVGGARRRARRQRHRLRRRGLQGQGERRRRGRGRAAERPRRHPRRRSTTARSRCAACRRAT